MKLIKTILAFLIGIIATFLCYRYINIPVLPSISVYPVFMMFLSDAHIKLRRIFVIITGIFGIYLFGAGAIESIIYYPEYMTILGIIFSFITAFSYIGSIVMGCVATSSKSR